MAEWWNALTAAERFFAYVAIPASVLLVIQIILQLVGVVGHGDADHGGGDGHDFADANHADSCELGIAHDGEAPDMHIDAHDAHGFHGGHGGHDGQDHDPGLRLFTFRGLVAFFAIGGWAGLALLRADAGIALAAFTSIVAGLAAMAGLAWLLREALRLQSDGSVDIENAIGMTGTAYLPIPAARGGKGKVTLVVQERLCEYEAVTDDGATIPTGAAIRVTRVEEGSALVVTRAD